MKEEKEINTMRKIMEFQKKMKFIELKLLKEILMEIKSIKLKEEK